MLGGIATDAQGASTLPGLYAAGEVACIPVHGAHRLDADALLAALVFGRCAGRAAAAHTPARHADGAPDVALTRARAEVEAVLERPAGVSYVDLREQLRRVMAEQAGPVRTRAGLEMALDAVRTLRLRFRGEASVTDRGHRFNTDLIGYLEARNLMDIAEAVVLGALRREESRGVHVRSDFPDRSDERFLKQTLVHRSSSGELDIAYAAVAVGAHAPAPRRA